MAAFGRFSGSRSPSSSDGGDGSFADNVNRELQGLADTLDRELGEEAIEPDYETHEFRAPPQAIQIEVEPGYSVVPRDGSSLAGLGQFEDTDLGLPIYATVNKNRKKRDPDQQVGIDNPVASTSYAAPPVIVPEIVVNQVYDDIDQQSEDGLGEGSRSNRGVSFTADTLDNEGTSRRYRKEKVHLGDIHRGKISSKDAVVTSNPIYESIGQDSNNKIFVNREFTGRTFPDSTVHTIPIIPSNRSYDGSVISYQYIGGESSDNNPQSQTSNTTLPSQPQPQEPKPFKPQFIPVTVERVGLPPLVAPTVEWSPDPGRSNQDYIIHTDENVSVISINSTSRQVGPFPNGSNTHVANPTREVAQPVPWPSPKLGSISTFEDEGQGYNVLIEKTKRKEKSQFMCRLAIIFALCLVALAVGGGLAAYFFTRDD